MRRLGLILSAALLLLAGCEKRALLPGTRHGGRTASSGGRMQAGSPDPLQEPGRTCLYMTAVRFADGYDWERDTSAALREAVIDIYQNGRRIKSFPAGESIEPDMHRFVGGHLYRDWSEGNETVVARDGEELFRYAGREALRGFLVLGDTVHTLGQRRDGAGLSYRIDGREVYRDGAGTVLGEPDATSWPGGALAPDGGKVYYSYSLPVSSGGSILREYRLLCGNTLVQTVQAGTFHDLSDIRVRDGTVWMVGQRTAAGSSLSLVRNQDIYSLGIGEREVPRLCRLAPWQDGMLVKGYSTAPQWTYRYQAIDAQGPVRTFPPGQHVRELLTEDSLAAWIVEDGRGQVQSLHKDTMALPLDEGPYTLLSGRCALLYEGVLYVALTGRDGTPNRLYVDGEATDFPFNGYFTSVCIE